MKFSVTLYYDKDAVAINPGNNEDRRWYELIQIAILGLYFLW